MEPGRRFYDQSNYQVQALHFGEATAFPRLMTLTRYQRQRLGMECNRIINVYLSMVIFVDAANRVNENSSQEVQNQLLCVHGCCSLVPLAARRTILVRVKQLKQELQVAPCTRATTMTVS